MGYKMDGNETFSYSTGLSESLTRSIKCRITVLPFKTISYTVFDGSWDTGNAIKAKKSHNVCNANQWQICVSLDTNFQRHISFF